jgi:hypothetical protein
MDRGEGPVEDRVGSGKQERVLYAKGRLLRCYAGVSSPEERIIDI